MKEVHDRFEELVILVGDNLHGSERPQDFKRKFEDPYKPLLDAGVKFYASLGNHDNTEQKTTRCSTWAGSVSYTFDPKKGVRFFALESMHPTPEQFAWFEKEVSASGAEWKMPFFHHPLYARQANGTGPTSHYAEHSADAIEKRRDRGVHRTRPHARAHEAPERHHLFRRRIGRKAAFGRHRQRHRHHGAWIRYRPRTFLVAEVDGDQLYFNTISRSGSLIDSGVIERRK